MKHNAVLFDVLRNSISRKGVSFWIEDNCATLSFIIALDMSQCE